MGFQIQNGIWIVEGWDNEELDDQGSTVLIPLKCISLLAKAYIILITYQQQQQL